MSVAQSHKNLFFPIYTPSLFMGLSNQGMSILYPLYALYLTGDPAFAALVAGLRAFGVMIFEIPAGYLASKFGNKKMLLFALFLSAGTMFGLALIDTLIFIALLAIPQGAASAIWFLSRQSYISDVAKRSHWGRTIALMAGINRAGALFGPFLGGLGATFFGYQITFLIGGLLIIIGLIFLAIYAENTHPKDSLVVDKKLPLKVILAENKKTLSYASFIALSIQLLRAARQLLVPIFGNALGLSAGTIGAVYALASLIDMSLFYPVGIIVDKYGRKWSAAPSILVFIIGILLLPFADNLMLFILVTCLLGLANGLGTGIVMLIGMDLAPPNNKNSFLALWRFIGDLGGFTGPVIASFFANSMGLLFVSTTVASFGFIALIFTIFLMPETLHAE